ncbi:zinc-finger-containing protein [Moritella sp.]|uniref:zinc-finger-containing protein n=1 Tax=Moritella sp. TaxID=78556 RepID=UPI0025DDE7FD|nr:zinc-finger-containing protein [Moritella sp.]
MAALGLDLQAIIATLIPNHHPVKIKGVRMYNHKSIRIQYQKDIWKYLLGQNSFHGVDLREFGIIATVLKIKFNVESNLSLMNLVQSIEDSNLSSIDKAKYTSVAGLLFAMKEGVTYKFAELKFNCQHCNSTVNGEHTCKSSRYVCSGCGAKVGLNKANYWPMGTLALSDVSYARVYCHERIDALWGKYEITRNAAYAEVARLLGIPRPLCHIGLIESLHEAGRFIAATDSLRLTLDEKNANC